MPEVLSMREKLANGIMLKQEASVQEKKHGRSENTDKGKKKQRYSLRVTKALYSEGTWSLQISRTPNIKEKSKDSIRQFTEEDIQVAHEDAKQRPTGLTVREIQDAVSVGRLLTVSRNSHTGEKGRIRKVFTRTSGD